MVTGTTGVAAPSPSLSLPHPLQGGQLVPWEQQPESLFKSLNQVRIPLSYPLPFPTMLSSMFSPLPFPYFPCMLLLLSTLSPTDPSPVGREALEPLPLHSSQAADGAGLSPRLSSISSSGNRQVHFSCICSQGDQQGRGCICHWHCPWLSPSPPGACLEWVPGTTAVVSEEVERKGGRSCH